jgi:carbamoyltransferase
MMGLAPFGRSDALGLPPLRVDENRVSIPEAWLEVFDERRAFTYFQDGRGSFDECAHLAAAGQHAFEEALLDVANWLHEATGARQLCFAGGTALNCSANGRLVREGPFREVFIPPSPHDGGTALGCALYGLRACLGIEPEFRWENDFLGPDPDPDAIDDAVQHAMPGFAVERPDDLVGRMAAMLDRGCVVALYNGRSESGPRALGNRSIIADARRAGMQDFINAHVKGREWFRPLAPLVSSDSAATIFDVDRPAPFMQYAATVRPEHRVALPAITHVDGTARLQTVDARNTPFLHELMRRFAERTGCPVLLNTSLNGKGDPLVETPADAMACLATTPMHALAMPPYLITKRVEPPIPS